MLRPAYMPARQGGSLVPGGRGSRGRATPASSAGPSSPVPAVLPPATCRSMLRCRSAPQTPTALCPWASQSMWCWLPACLHAR